MATLTGTTLFKTPEPRPETPIDKTTRAAAEIIDGETKRRENKTARLRKARLERETGVSVKPVASVSNRARAKPSVKAIK